MRSQIRTSEMFLNTARQIPSGAETPGHQLLLRAGYIRSISSGVYGLNPLAMRVLWKIEAIVRTEMNNIGGLEVHAPIIQPQEYWEQSGRWKKYVSTQTMLTTTDRRGVTYGLSPTAEEVITFMVKCGLASHTQLPVNYWQVDWKFRDEIRPRMGLLRCKTFRMKDAYTFDPTEEKMRESFELHRQAYTRMFTSMGFDFLSVQADSGAIGGKGSAEFMARCEVGEDVLLTCPGCGYGANREKAEGQLETVHKGDNTPMHEESTPNIRTVAGLFDFFGLNPQRMVKTIIYEADGNPVAVCIRGDREINEIKLQNLLGVSSLRIADEELVVRVTRAPVGFAGPFGLDPNTRIIYDQSVATTDNFICGCCELDKHRLDVKLGRDLPNPEKFYDLHDAKAGDRCPNCAEGTLTESRGIELGHIFMLQQVYSRSMDITFTDNTGAKLYPWMGCYGLGTTRCIQALVEQHHDDRGIVWPKSVAPFEFVIVPTDSRIGSVQMATAERVFTELSRLGKEAVFDDRGGRFGELMADAELIGYPTIVIVGKKAGQDILEVRDRASGKSEEMPISQFLS